MDHNHNFLYFEANGKKVNSHKKWDNFIVYFVLIKISKYNYLLKTFTNIMIG